MSHRYLDIGVEYRGRLSRLVSIGVVMDSERQTSATEKPRTANRLVRAGRIPLPLRRNHVLSDMLKIVLILTFAAYGLCCQSYHAPLTRFSTGALASSIGYSRRAKGCSASLTTTSITCSPARAEVWTRIYGKSHSRLLSTMQNWYRYTLTMTILVAFLCSRHLLPGASALKPTST
jgi:hypothetical protein